MPILELTAAAFLAAAAARFRRGEESISTGRIHEPYVEKSMGFTSELEAIARLSDHNIEVKERTSMDDRAATVAKRGACRADGSLATPAEVLEVLFDQMNVGNAGTSRFIDPAGDALMAGDTSAFRMGSWNAAKRFLLQWHHGVLYGNRSHMHER